MPHFSVVFLILILIGYKQVNSQEVFQPIRENIITNSNPLDTLLFDQIIAYNINFDSTNNKGTVDQSGSHVDDYDLSPKYTSSKKNVDPTLFNDIINLFSDTATYSSFVGDCFAPRFVLQFKFKRQERFRIIICQECSNLITTTPIYSSDKTTYKINGKLESVYKNEKDLSWEGSKNLDKLCKTLKMGYCKNYK